MKRKTLTALLIGAAAMYAVTAQAQVYSDTDTVKAVQEKLNEAGFACGTADGIAGSRTTEAVMAYQNASQLTPSGEIDDELLVSMGLLATEDGTGDQDAEADDTEDQNDAQESAADSDADSEVSEDPVENLTIDGTVIYNAHQVAVTAKLSEDGERIVYQVQNDTENPVIMMPGTVIANEVILEEGKVEDGDGAEYSYLMDASVDVIISDSKEDFGWKGSIYAEGKSTGSSEVFIDSDLKDVFSYDKVQKLQTCVGVIGLSKELLFNQTDELENYEESVSFVEAGSLTDVEIPGAVWDGTWTEVEGNVLYEDDEIRLIDTGCDMVGTGYCYVGLVRENRSEDIIEVSDVYDTEAMLNGETVEYPHCRGTALPGTRTSGFLNLDLDGIEEEADVTSAYCLLEIQIATKTPYETIAEVEYTFSADADSNLSKERADEKAAEKEAMSLKIEEQIIYESDGFVIKATGASEDDMTARQLINLEITNSTDTDASVYLNSLAGEDEYICVNGYQTYGGAVIDVPAGQTVEDTCYLDVNMLKAAGIDNIGEVELQFFIQDDSYEIIAEVKKSVIHTSEYENMDTELREDMQLIYSENGFDIYAKYIEGEPGWADHILCAVQNNTDEGAGVHLSELKINGAVYEGCTKYASWDYIWPGKTYLITYPVQDYIETNGISEVESLSINLDIGARYDWQTPLFTTGETAVPVK